MPVAARILAAVAAVFLMIAPRVGASQSGPGIYGRVEYLAWWTNDAGLPPLVTTSPDGTPRVEAGVLGEAGTSILFGDHYGDERRDGGRVTVGMWLDDARAFGIEGSWFALGNVNDGDGFRFESDDEGTPILARPFFDSSTGLESAELVSFPDIVAGAVSGELDSEIQSAGILLRYNVDRSPTLRVDFLGGYRFFRIGESLSIHEELTSIDTGGLIPVGTAFDVQDEFHTSSEFHGGDIGLLVVTQHDSITFEARGKVAMGNVHNQTMINGVTTVTVPGVDPVTTVGGLLAQPTNIGRFTDDQFALLPEATFDVKYQLTERVRAVAGYSFVYLNKAMRVGEQVDSTVNSTQIGGGVLSGDPSPAPRTANSGLWMQGVSLGFDYVW